MNDPVSGAALTPVGARTRRQLLDLYARLLADTDAGAALGTALDRDPPSPGRPIHVLAIGKAAPAMARSATAWMARREYNLAGGLIVGTRLVDSPHPALSAVAGDHPIPAAASYAAAQRLRLAADAVGDGDTVLLLLSGGASSLIAAPVAGVSPGDLSTLFRVLLASGLDIAATNAVRKRFTVWGGGRLARALAPARVDQFLVSDVPGDDPAIIGSGPAVPDPTSIMEVRALLGRIGATDRVPPAIAAALMTEPCLPALRTIPPGDPVFTTVRTNVIATNRLAVRSGADAAEALGYHARTFDEPLTGDAADAGARLARAVVAAYRGLEAPRALVWGGETTVRLDRSAPPGGRCQEVALAAARELAGLDDSAGVALLAAGTDGRDGPTDAAGAIVDPTTWEAIRRGGRDPAEDLHRHRAHDALAAAGALIPRRDTHTNVMDVVVALLVPPGAGPTA